MKTNTPAEDDKGKWFYANYGSEVVVGQCVGRAWNGDYLLSFRWGNPFRTVQRVCAGYVMCEAPDPRWTAKIMRLFNKKI